jgi:hypothetical protein
MSSTTRLFIGVAAVSAVIGSAQLIPAIALADPPPQPQPQQAQQELHNITYRARADGTSRGAVVAYKMDDTNVNSAEPTLLPTRTFEVNAVLANPQLAGMQISIQWPYGSNLHCEIEVDGAVVAQADQFIAPRLTRAKDDPMYGTLECGAPLNLAVPGDGGGNAVNTNPVDASIPADGAAPPDPATPAEPAPPTDAPPAA